MFHHIPVLLQEVLQALRPQTGRRYVDGCVGGGGHAAAILRSSAPSGWLFGFDRDGAAVEACKERLAEFSNRCEIRRANFADMGQWVDEGSCAGVLLDLGVSSHQLDSAERGFSFQQDGPLDMRMDQRQELTAARLLRETEPAELAKIFWDYGGEPNARRIAQAIAMERGTRPLERTRQLAELIERISPRAGRKAHPATKVFQAVRVVVNDEMGSVRRGLEAALQVLQPGGRLAVITFHSLEDRVAKEFGRRWERDYEPAEGADVPELRRPRPARLKWVTRKAVTPGAAELKANPRSRSAQLRVFEKL